MKKILKIIITNLFICTFLLCSAEFICTYIVYLQHDHTNYPFSSHIKNVWKSYQDISYFHDFEFRKKSEPNTETNKPPIAIMGCSFAYGLGLKEDETFAAHLSKETGRTVYNLGLTASSPREMLYILRNEKYRTKLFENRNDFEYIIYPYISHHLFRLYNQIRILTPSPKFKLRGDYLEFYETNNFIFRTQLYKKVMEIRYYVIDGKKSFNLMQIYLQEINKEIKKYFPNAKFVVLIYEDYKMQDWSVFDKTDIKIINLENLLNINLKHRPYTISAQDKHPNSKAWEKVVPPLSKVLNL